MNLDAAVEGMMDAKERLRSPQGVRSPMFISEQMQRLAQYTAAVEDILGEYEEDLEFQESAAFIRYNKDGKSANASEKLAKIDVSETKGQIAKLKRYVNSGWKIVGVSQSRINHLGLENKGQV